MGTSGSVTLRWCGARHTFRLGIDELVALQDRTGHGPEEVMRRLQGGDWHVDDVRETLRLGLIGAGMAASKADVLIVRNVEDRPLMASKLAALEVMRATLLPFVEHPLPGKAGATGSAATAASSSPT